MRALVLVLLAAGSASAAPLIETTGDLDGKPGDEAIVLEPDGTLRAGAASTTVTFAAADTAFDRQRRLAVVSLGGARRGVVLGMPTEGSEDPPNRTQVFLYTGGALRLVFDQVGPEPVFDARGVGRYLESAWVACERASKPGQQKMPKARLDQFTLRLNRAGTKLVSTRSRSAEVFDCDQLAACPFVYELEGDSAPQLAGEILRDLRGSGAYALQSLDLRARAAGTMRVRLAEEKPETTYLDEIYVEVDGTRIRPKTCAGAAPPAYCVADQRPYVLREGETLDLELDVPAGTRVLFGRGYYIPR